VRVLVVDDYEPWHGFVSTTLRKEPGLEIVGRVFDGLEAVQQAQQLEPDLILLDINLPTLNGIEAARQIRQVSPKSKILFISENHSQDIAEQALSTGACGYVVKADAGREFLPALKAILEGKRFTSASLAGLGSTELTDEQNAQRRKIVAPFPEKRNVRHEVEFYADDAGFVDGFARFIEAALTERAVIVIATESHHANLIQRLRADGLNVAAKMKEGSYIPLQVADVLSSFMVNDSFDPVLFRKSAGDLITKAAKGTKGEHRQVAACGEGVNVFLAAGNLEATMMLERLWDEIARHYKVDVLCGYFRSAFASPESVSVLERICAEHSAAHGRGLCY
jgi:DNA-binding NarL/FixJ family response regulator